MCGFNEVTLAHSSSRKVMETLDVFDDFKGKKWNIDVKRVNSLRANPTKWSNTLKQLVGNLPTNCLSVFEHFVGLALKGLSVLSFPSNFQWK